MDDEEAVIPKLVAISKGAKRPHHEAVHRDSKIVLRFSSEK